MIWYAINAAQEASQNTPVVVCGHGAEDLMRELDGKAQFVMQEEQLGTGHAVLQAENSLVNDADLVLVTYADMPMLTQKTLQDLIATQQSNSGPMTLLSVEAKLPRGFGRIVRDAQGDIQSIVEEAQASEDQLRITELNVGAYCFKADWLWDSLKRIPISPKGEYYLTDTVHSARTEHLPVLAVKLEDEKEAIGVNTRIHLAEATAAMQERINQHWMLSGVTIIDPQRTYIEPEVIIGQDSVIWPESYLIGSSQIGDDCTIGPNAFIQDTKIGNSCEIVSSVLEDAVLEDRVDVGPYSHLRKGTHLLEDVHVGNFGEVKNSTLGRGTKMGHFSYIGDATIGANVNIGAGTITCNFDGEKKHPTEIEADVFIGSDTMLVAPIKIGKGARTGAGSVVTKDVPANTLVVGMPARGVRKVKKK
jgi:bifunctional UDP-N-acetylglucosamine pyrophosphorylase/glucosamine-1-phosphate N-acetyltransferase